MSDDRLAAVSAAYQGVDDLDSFRGGAALEAYRASLLARTRKQADVVAELLPQGARVVEAACGNGRLLVELARRGALADGLGFDIATSRIDFARAWAQDAGLPVLRFEVRDALGVELAAGGFDAGVLITGALGYFDAARTGLAGDVLRQLRTALRDGGALVLELYPHPRERALLEAAGGEVRTWRELDADDPWRFYLSHLRLEGDILEHRKTFVHRTSGAVDDSRQEALVLYSPASITALLKDAGFRDVRCREGWSAAAYAGGDQLVVVARR